MTCDAPIQAYKAGSVNPATGKRPMQFRVAGSFSGVRQMLPCGKCAGCRLDHSRVWAIRLMHEKRMHKESVFVTLTYRKEDLPDVGTLVKEHLQAFHKRVHNRLVYDRGFGIRYYGVGEYGELNKRPHYHSILFGVRPKDAKLYSRALGEPLYTSDWLDGLWTHGDTKFGEVTFESAQYCAKYCLKKVDGKKREAGHYLVYDGDGVVHERLPEFSHMSRRPGIGATYFEKYGSEIATHDTIIVSGKEVPSIRYYDLKIDPHRLVVIKRNRSRKRWLQPFIERGPDRRRVKEVLRIKMMKMKERTL
ncbi:MAG: replication initiator protein [Microvirus sp.]|nr:MAG: replication initiator protein [Microvirus sp.]